MLSQVINVTFLAYRKIHYLKITLLCALTIDDAITLVTYVR